MARTRGRSTARRSKTRRLLLVLLLVVLGVFSLTALASKDSKQRRVKHSGSDLVCHTDVAAECYPRVFQAIDEFQPVHPDQDLPPGLHVRLNVYTGEREAKLNDPAEEPPAGLEGLPVDQSVVLVDAPAAEAEADPSAALPLPKGAPAYDPAGLVKEPPKGGSGGGDGGDALDFYEALAAVKDRGVATEPAHAAESALEQLGEFAHDVYYGLKLVEDDQAMWAMLCLMSGGTDASVPGSSGKSAQMAASIVGAAVQNNPTALRALEQRWDAYMKATFQPAGGAAMALGDAIFGPYLGSDDGSSSNPSLVRSRLLAINGLIKSKAIMKDFLASGGLTEVLRLLVDQDGNPAYDAARTRAANLVQDNFLDASMGADVTLWPGSGGEGRGSGEAGNAACGSDGPIQAHCWDYHVQKLAAAHGGDAGHWSHELWQRLQARRGHAGSAAHDEL